MAAAKKAGDVGEHAGRVVAGGTGGRPRIKALLFFDEADLMKKGEGTKWSK